MSSHSASELPLLKISEISAKSLLQRVLFLSVFSRAYKSNIQIPKVLFLKMVIQWEKHTASVPIYGKSEKFFKNVENINKVPFRMKRNLVLISVMFLGNGKDRQLSILLI